jgi:meso-butanediol dehydrogenase/(S,S)-butanediol dehydrogenase/diacetyl reductase
MTIINPSIAGRVALITGGTSGIGKAAVRDFVAHGAKVMFSGTRKDAGEQIAKDLSVQYGTGVVEFFCGDVADQGQIKAMVSATEKAFGRIDILFNNAGIACFGETPNLAEEEWHRVFAVDLHAIFYACKEVIPIMCRQGGGVIINNASISGIGGDYAFSAYAAAKGGVINYTRTLALDCARHRIRVNAVCPGLIDTAVAHHSIEMPVLRQAFEANIPLGRPGFAEEVSGLVRFLASDEAAYITGALIPVDGGLTAWSGMPNMPRVLGMV